MYVYKKLNPIFCCRTPDILNSRSSFNTLNHWYIQIEPLPHLLPPLQSALDRDRETAITFPLDQSTDPSVISLCQSYGRQSVLPPLFQVCRAWIWPAHRTRMRLLGIERYLL